MKRLRLHSCLDDVQGNCAQPRRCAGYRTGDGSGKRFRDVLDDERLEVFVDAKVREEECRFAEHVDGQARPQRPWPRTFDDVDERGVRRARHLCFHLERVRVRLFAESRGCVVERQVCVCDGCERRRFASRAEQRSRANLCAGDLALYFDDFERRGDESRDWPDERSCDEGSPPSDGLVSHGLVHSFSPHPECGERERVEYGHAEEWRCDPSVRAHDTLRSHHVERYARHGHARADLRSIFECVERVSDDRSDDAGDAARERLRRRVTRTHTTRKTTG